MTNFASTAPQYSYRFVDTTNGAADVTVKNSYLLFGSTNQRVCEYKNLIPGACTITPYAAETLQVTTVTPTAAASSTYSLYISQYNSNTGSIMTRFYTYTTASSGDTATTIGDALRAQINADQSNGVIQVVGTGTTTLILTAQAGYPVFAVTLVSLGGGLAQSTGTAGVVGYGSSTSLAAEGYTGYTGTTYTRWHLEFYARLNESNTLAQGQRVAWDAFLNTAATNYAALLAAIKDVMSNYPVGGTTVANPEALSLLDS